jgi:iron complex outermembrane receptor protein
MEIFKNLNTFICFFCLFLTNLSFSQIKNDKNTLENYDWLNEVIISTNKDATKLKESVVGISLLKPYLIENKISLDAGKILNQVPGVVVNDGQINIRSGSGWSYGAGSRVMVTLDEMPMLAGDVGSVPFNFLPIESVSGIEVIKNAGSVLYGSSALNGIVNLRSAPIRNQQNLNVNVVAGFYQIPDELKFSNKKQINYGVNGCYTEKIDNHSLMFTWNQLNDDGYRMNEHDYRVRIGWKYGFEFSSKSILSPLKLWLNGGTQRGKSGSFLIWQNDKKGYTSLDSSFSINTGRRVNIDPILEWNGKKWKHKFLNRYFSIDNQINNGDTSSHQDNKSVLLYSELKSKRSFGNFDLTLGLVRINTKSEAQMFNGNHIIENRSAYSQLQYKQNGWIAQVGGRYEHYNLDGNIAAKPVFRAGINKQLGQGTFIRASYGEGFRYPSIAEMFTTTSTGSIFILPNADLKPETGNNLEIGVKQGISLGNKKVGIFNTYIDLSIFQNKYQNMMEYSFGSWFIGDFGSFKSVNMGSTTIKGFEIESAGAFEKSTNIKNVDGSNKTYKIEWLMGYTYSNPTIDDQNFVFGVHSNSDPMTFNNTAANPTNILKYRNRHVFRGDIQFSLGGFEIGFSQKYQSAFENIDLSFLTLIDGINSNWKSGNNAGLITDIRAGYRLNENIKVQLQMSNVTQNIFMGRPADLNAPRFYQMQLNYKFLGPDKDKIIRQKKDLESR